MFTNIPKPRTCSTYLSAPESTGLLRLCSSRDASPRSFVLVFICLVNCALRFSEVPIDRK